MYERSAIVLERYFEKLFGFDKENNLRTNYENYKKLIEELKKYQGIVEEEEKIIRKFDEIATEIEEIQNEQAKIHESNLELENQRNRLFNDLGENPNLLDKKLHKIEESVQKNNNELSQLRERYVKSLVIFIERQKERNRYSRIRRTAESDYRKNIENANKVFEEISTKDMQEVKKFINLDKEEKQKEITAIMLKNGKNEKIPFNNQAIERVVKIRMNIAQKEAELYISIYDKSKKTLNELDYETIKISRIEKLLRDVSVKLTFLNVIKEYLVGFLDNERMTAINGEKAHGKLMEEAIKNFDSDMNQIANLYELIMKETTGKSTKKAYKELYNKNYLKDIEQKEKNFEKEVTNIRINMGTVINSNYWRIEGIKNIYKVFQEEISEKFNKDLSEYKIEQIEEETDSQEKDIKDQKYEKNDYYKREEDTQQHEKNKEEQDDIQEEYEEEYEEENNYDNEVYRQDSYAQYYEEDDEDDIYIFKYEEDEVDEYDDDEDEDVIIEDKIDKIIRNSRRTPSYRREENKSKGLLGKLFKK